MRAPISHRPSTPPTALPAPSAPLPPLLHPSKHVRCDLHARVCPTGLACDCMYAPAAVHPRDAESRNAARERGVVNMHDIFPHDHARAALNIATTLPPSSSPPGPSSAFDTASGASSAIQSLTSASTLSNLDGRLDLSPHDSATSQGLLRTSVFDEWKNDAGDLEAENPEEMQKNDPLGTQIWKLYHKQKNQLPNRERMENLTWRLMSMNLRRKELERQG